MADRNQTDRDHFKNWLDLLGIEYTEVGPLVITLVRPYRFDDEGVCVAVEAVA